MLRPRIDAEGVESLNAEICNRTLKRKGVLQAGAAGSLRRYRTDHQNALHQEKNPRCQQVALPLFVPADQQAIEKHGQEHHVALVGKAVQKIGEQRKEKIPPLAFAAEIAVQEVSL